MGALIVPVVLAASAALLTSAQTQRELAGAHLRAQDEALQQYLDQVSNLLELAPIGGPLFAHHNCEGLRKVSRLPLVTYATRLLARPLSFALDD